MKFSVEDGKIRFGLLGIKNLGEGPITAIIEARTNKGMPKDIFQFIDNLDIHKVNKKAVESLIKSGAMDCLNDNRAAHLAVYESLIESAQSSAKNVIEGQMSLFQLNAETMEKTQVSRLPDVADVNKDTRIGWEKELLGVYLTEHPLKEYEEKIRRSVSVTAQDLMDVLDNEEQGEAHSFVKDGMKAVMAGIITGKKTLITKNNKMMAFVDMEDLYGPVEVVVFPNVYDRYSSLVAEDSIISVSGTINFKEGEVPKLLAETIVDLKSLKEIESDDAKGAAASVQSAVRQGNGTVRFAYDQRQPSDPEGIVKIKLPAGDRNILLEQIRQVMLKHRGRYQAIIYMAEGGSFRTEENLWVDPDMDFRKEIIDIVGESNYKG